MRNLDAGPRGRLNAVEALFLAERDFDSVDDDRGHGLSSRDKLAPVSYVGSD